MDRDRFIELWERGVPVAEMAAIFACSPAWISVCAKRFGLAGRMGRPARRGMEKVRRPVVQMREDAPRLSWTRDRDRKIMATQGRYSEIAKLAERWGIASASINARWLAIRSTRETLEDRDCP